MAAVIQSKHPTEKTELKPEGSWLAKRFFLDMRSPFPAGSWRRGARGGPSRDAGPRSPSGPEMPAKEFVRKKPTEPCHPYCFHLFLGNWAPANRYRVLNLQREFPTQFAATQPRSSWQHCAGGVGRGYKGGQEMNPSTHKPRPLWASAKAGGCPASCCQDWTVETLIGWRVCPLWVFCTHQARIWCIMCCRATSSIPASVLSHQDWHAAFLLLLNTYWAGVAPRFWQIWRDFLQDKKYKITNSKWSMKVKWRKQKQL